MDALRRRARALRNESTDAERLLWQHLRNRQVGGFKFRRQSPVAGYIADFLCPALKLIVELDGGQHADRGGYDHVRTARLEALGFRVVRYWNHEVMQATDAVLEDLGREVSARARGLGER